MGFMMQAMWVASAVKGLLTVPPHAECCKEIERWEECERHFADGYAGIDSQTAYMKRLADDVGYKVDLDTAQLFRDWLHAKQENVVTYRDKSCRSKFTLEDAPVSSVPWPQCFDDSLESFINNSY